MGCLPAYAERISNTRGEQGGGSIIPIVLIVGVILFAKVFGGPILRIERWNRLRHDRQRWARNVPEEELERRARARGMTVEEYRQWKEKWRLRPLNISSRWFRLKFGFPDNAFGLMLQLISLIFILICTLIFVGVLVLLFKLFLIGFDFPVLN